MEVKTDAMKKFEKAEIVTIELSATGFGPTEPNTEDGKKYTVDGGYEQLWGVPKPSGEQ